MNINLLLSWDNSISLISYLREQDRGWNNFQFNYQLTDHIKRHSRNRCPGPFVVDLVEKKTQRKKKRKERFMRQDYIRSFDLRGKIKIHLARGTMLCAPASLFTSAGERKQINGRWHATERKRREKRDESCEINSQGNLKLKVSLYSRVSEEASKEEESKMPVDCCVSPSYTKWRERSTEEKKN